MAAGPAHHAVIKAGNHLDVPSTFVNVQKSSLHLLCLWCGRVGGRPEMLFHFLRLALFCSIMIYGLLGGSSLEYVRIGVQ